MLQSPALSVNTNYTQFLCFCRYENSNHKQTINLSPGEFNCCVFLLLPNTNKRPCFFNKDMSYLWPNEQLLCSLHQSVYMIPQRIEIIIIKLRQAYSQTKSIFTQPILTRIKRVGTEFIQQTSCCSLHLAIDLLYNINEICLLCSMCQHLLTRLFYNIK